MNENCKKATILIYKATFGTGDLYHLCGPANKPLRIALMTLITGENLPAYKCGLNAVMKAIYNMAGTTGNCGAAYRDNFKDWMDAELSA